MKTVLSIFVFSTLLAYVHGQNYAIPESFSGCTCRGKQIRGSVSLKWKALDNDNIVYGVLVTCPSRCVDRIFLRDTLGIWIDFVIPDAPKHRHVRVFPHDNGYCYIKLDRWHIYKVFYETLTYVRVSRQVFGHDDAGPLQ